MKIVRFKYENKIQYGKIEDKSVYFISGDIFSDFIVTDEKVDAEKIEILAPVMPPNIIAIGLNYKDHAKELEMVSERPAIFIKANTSLLAHDKSIIRPKKHPDYVDFEAELAVIIKKSAKDIKPEEADDYILGYTCANDVTARDCQMMLDNQWARAKSFDTFCPTGPFIVTDVKTDNLHIESRVNGNVMQSASTADMIFNAKELVAYCSENMTLLPGTLILTGTPKGVGHSKNPPVYLKTGDKVEIEIEGIGTLLNHVR